MVESKTVTRCLTCGSGLPAGKTRGRKQVYCDATCRSRARRCRVEEPKNVNSDLTLSGLSSTIDAVATGLDVPTAAVTQSILACMVELVSTLGAGPAGTVPSIGIAHRLIAEAEGALAAMVGRARSTGCTWAEIGAAMNTSRQSAFQRFGSVRPELADDVRRAAVERAEAIFTALSVGDYATVRADFDDQLTENLTAEQLGGVWASVTGEVGSLSAQGRPFARLVGEHVVVDVPMEFEAGDMTGRLAFDDADKIAGLFVLRQQSQR